MMKVYFASDHAGVELKSILYEDLLLNTNKHQKFIKEFVEPIDLGPSTTDSVDYPDFADLACKKLHTLELVKEGGGSLRPAEVAVLICGSGQGMAMRANKYSHIRAGLCWNVETTKLSREHNDANVLCLGARFISADLAVQMLHTFLTTEFSGGRHQQRVAKLAART